MDGNDFIFLICFAELFQSCTFIQKEMECSRTAKIRQCARV